MLTLGDCDAVSAGSVLGGQGTVQGERKRGGTGREIAIVLTRLLGVDRSKETNKIIHLVLLNRAHGISEEIVEFIGGGRKHWGVLDVGVKGRKAWGTYTARVETFNASNTAAFARHEHGALNNNT